MLVTLEKNVHFMILLQLGDALYCGPIAQFQQQPHVIIFFEFLIVPLTNAPMSFEYGNMGALIDSKLL